MKPTRRYVGVIGAVQASGEHLELAAEVGRLVAQAGGVIVCGGRGGVMEAACRGAAAAGGVSIGILPEETRVHANPYVTYALPTGLGQARNVLVILASDVLIAVGGAYGTLSEIGHALKLGRTVVGLQTWELSGPGAAACSVVVADTAQQAVDLALGRPHTRSER